MLSLIKKFFSILSNNQKRYLIYIIILSFIGALLEMMTLGLLVPIIGLLNSETLSNNYLVSSILTSISFLLKKFGNNEISVLIVLFFIIFIFKTIFFTGLIKLSSKFSSSISFNLSSKIFENYLYQKYYFYLSRGSSKLIQNITNEISNLINIYLASILSLFNEVLLLISISAVLIILSPISFFSMMSVFFLFSFIFVYLIKKFLKKWGYQRQDHQENSIKYLQEGMRGIKELRIYNLEKNFLDYFKFHTKKYLKIEENINFISIVPKYYIELLGVISFVVVFRILFSNNYQYSEIILILGIFAASALKILPSINKVINSIVKIKYSYSAVNLIYNEINLKKYFYKNKINNKLTFKKNLTFQKVFFKHENNQSFLFRNINLKIPLNRIIGVFGESGSGKTTLIDLIIGFLKPNKGTICADGKNINNYLRSWQNNIGYVQQFSYFIEDSIKNNITLGLKNESLDINRISECLKIVGLNKIIERLPNKIQTRISELGNNFSGGQRQRLSIARALYKDPSILVLDEATNSLDENSENTIIKNIIKSNKDRTIIIVTHKKKFLKYCDVVFEVNNGDIKKKK
jgi:ABC-type bacteriocin/lantibiotic exporter with double-glycine peptidase domain